jgi:hypothetical protein
VAGPTHGKKGHNAEAGMTGPKRAKMMDAERKAARGGPIKPLPTGRRLLFNKAGKLVSRPNGKRKRNS